MYNVHILYNLSIITFSGKLHIKSFFSSKRVITTNGCHSPFLERSDIRNLASEIWHQKSDIRDLASEIWHQKSDIKNLASEIWHQRSDIRNLTSETRSGFAQALTTLLIHLGNKSLYVNQTIIV